MFNRYNIGTVSHFRPNLNDPGFNGHSFNCQGLRSHYLAAFVGAMVALTLGGAGFALGCAYGRIVPPTTLVGIETTPAYAPVSAGTATHAAMPASDAASPPASPSGSTPEGTSAVQALAMLRPVSGGWVSSRYGRRADPFTGRPAVHRGVDYAAAGRTAIRAVATGVVTWSGPDGGYGNMIEIDHGNGWVTRYGHNARNLVLRGDYVKPGQTIALMGSTGRATGTHLHFEILFHGQRQNPARLLPSDA
ncbi:MAG: M23 family metallopeptidase [Gammaproteobacteria bacterium]